MGSSSVLKTFCLLLLALNLGCHARPNDGQRQRRGQSPRSTSGTGSLHERLLKGAGCTLPPPAEIAAPVPNIWNPLTPGESRGLEKWLHDQPEFNLSRGYRDGHNYIGEFELVQPNKSDVLAYLDAGGPAPPRYASVFLYNQATETPNISTIIVGPLPVSNGSNASAPTTSWQWDYTVTRKTPIRLLSGGLNSNYYSRWVKNITKEIDDITMDLWNATANGRNATIYYYPGSYPTIQYDNVITEWNQYGGAEGLGLYFGLELDLYGRDPDSWKFKGWLYNNIFYPTTQDFRDAYFSPGFETLPVNIDGNTPFYDTNQKGPILPLDDEAPPMPIGGKVARFSVDYEENYVEWMGFSFYISQNTDTGMGLHDVRFKGERIIFEMGMQEAMAHYAAINPVQSTVAYLDGAFGFGSAAVELMPGYDCPTYATYLNISWGGYKSENAVCMFEFDADYPIQRHAYESNTKNIYFVLRTVNTVGNYDYQLNYEFYMDGSMQIVVRAAGFIISTYYGNNHDYGYKIRDVMSGSMHDHVLQFKVDFDIMGTDNTMELVTVTPTTENYAWSDHPRNTMKLVRHELESEDESQLFWSGNGATQYRIINKDSPNQFGEYRGYRILPSQGTIHLTTQNSSVLANAGNFAKYDLAVTQHKDSEPRSVHPLNDQDVYEPMVDFDAFFDGDNLQQQDLVTWVNLGMHHVPHTGDLPNTVFTTAHSSVQITPSNYFFRDQSRDTVNMVRINYGKQTTVNAFGQAHQVCQANLSQLSYGYY